MRLSFTASAAILAACACNSVRADCKMLSNPDNMFVQTLAGLLGEQDKLKEIPFDKVFGPIEAVAPYLSQCVASINVGDIAPKLLSDTRANECLQQLNATSNGYYSLASEVNNYVCPLLQNTIVPCMDDVILKYAKQAMTTQKDCCSALQQKFVEWSGYDLQTMVSLLLKHIGNVICSTQTVKSSNGTMSTETCAVTLVNQLNYVEYWEVGGLFQIPTSQACDAFAGKPFTLANGSDGSVFSTNRFLKPGACLKPVDELFDHISKYPVLKQLTATVNGTAVDLTSIFAADKCMPGDWFMGWLTADDGLMMTVIQTYTDTRQGLYRIGRGSYEGSYDGSYRGSYAGSGSYFSSGSFYRGGSSYGSNFAASRQGSSWGDNATAPAWASGSNAAGNASSYNATHVPAWASSSGSGNHTTSSFGHRVLSNATKEGANATNVTAGSLNAGQDGEWVYDPTSNGYRWYAANSTNGINGTTAGAGNATRTAPAPTPTATQYYYYDQPHVDGSGSYYAYDWDSDTYHRMNYSQYVKWTLRRMFPRNVDQWCFHAPHGVADKCETSATVAEPFDVSPPAATTGNATNVTTKSQNSAVQIAGNSVVLGVATVLLVFG